MAVTLVGLVISIMPPGLASHRPRPSWQPRLEIAAYDPAYLDLFSDGRGFALQYVSGHPDYTSQPRPFLFTTSNFGKTWTEVSAPDGAYVSDFSSPNVGYAFTTDQAGRNLLRTSDGAETWEVLQDPSADPKGAESAGAYFDVLSAPTDEVVLMGGSVSRYYGGCNWESRAALYRSEDGGRSFIGVELPFDGVVHQLEMLDATHGVMLVSEWDRTNDPVECSSEVDSVRMHAMATHDGGNSWAPVAEEPYDFGSPPSKMGMHSVGIAASDRLFLGMSNGDIFSSHDSGATFVKAEGTTNKTFPEVDGHHLSRIEFIRFATPNIGYAVSAHGAVWKTKDGGVTWRQEPSLQADGDYSFSTGLAVATPQTAIVAAHRKLSGRVPRH